MSQFYVNQYRIMSPLGKMNLESAARVADFYNSHTCGTPATATELGVSGAFMKSLVQRGYAKVVGKREGDFYPVGNGLYRKSECNEYVLTTTAAMFWHDYTKSIEGIANGLKRDATDAIDCAQRKLAEAKCMLERVGAIRI